MRDSLHWQYILQYVFLSGLMRSELNPIKSKINFSLRQERREE